MSYQGGHGSIDSQSTARGRDVVGQVGDDRRLIAEQRPWIEGLRVGADDFQPSRIPPCDLFERPERALVALHRDDAPRAQCQQRARQAAGAGTDFDHRGVLQRPCRARNPRSEVEVEQEILAERFAGRQGMLANDLAKRRQVVDRAHAGCAAAMRAASRNAAIRLDGLARPVPAMSKAVPWSGEVRMNGNPRVTLTASSKASVLIGISA
jgi:hypothetical protein